VVELVIGPGIKGGTIEKLAQAIRRIPNENI